MISIAEQQARTIVKEYLGIREADVVLITGGIHVFELIENLALGIRSQLANPVIMVTSDRLYQRTLEDMDEDSLGRTPRHLLRWLDDINAIIDIDAVRDPSFARNVPEAKVGACRRAWAPIYKKQMERGIKWMYITCPSPEKASLYGVDYDVLCGHYLEALSADGHQIGTLGRRIAGAIGDGRDVRISSPAGTDLTLSVAGRPALIDDGVICDQDAESGFVTSNLPCGEVFYAPVETSATGIAVFEQVCCRGRVLDRVAVEFEQGRVKSVTGDGADLVRERLAGASGDGDRIGEFGIGLNPGLLAPTHDPILDEKVFGSVHLALGENRAFQGANESDHHWDLLILAPTVSSSGRVVCRDGKFTDI